MFKRNKNCATVFIKDVQEVMDKILTALKEKDIELRM